MSKLRLTDLLLGFCSMGTVLLHAKDIRNVDKSGDESAELASECHIYLILTRPRVTYVPGSLVQEEGWTRGKFQYRIKGEIKEAQFKLEGRPEPGWAISISDYPHSKLEMRHETGQYHSIPAHLMSLMAIVTDNELSRLKVMYVGMSYADGKRSAVDRLSSHSTLQAVLADINHDEPDNEALLLLVKYDDPLVFITFNGRDESLRIEDDRDVGEDLARTRAAISKELQIALIEAGLIKYFQPKYNDKYTKRFPHPTHEILREVYGIEFGALSVEINTEDLNFCLYSDVRAAGYHHMAQYDLYKPEVRRSYFNVMNVSDGPDADTFSGPLY